MKEAQECIASCAVNDDVGIKCPVFSSPSGRVDKQGALTGQKIAYIYPDFHSALIGVFVDGVMKEAQECIASCAVNDDVGIKCPVFSSPSGPIHRRQISDFDVICTDPRVPDPYES